MPRANELILKIKAIRSYQEGPEKEVVKHIGKILSSMELVDADVLQARYLVRSKDGQNSEPISAAVILALLDALEAMRETKPQT